MANITPEQKHDSSLLHSKWKTTEPVPLTSQSFMDLLEGRTPLLSFPAFLSRETARRFERELEPRFSPYQNSTGPSVDKIGVAQFEYQAQSQDDFKTRTGKEKDSYFSAVEGLAGFHEELHSRVGVDAFQAVFDTIAQLIPADWEIGLATEAPNRTYFAGIIRGINNGTLLHCDWCPYDAVTEPWTVTAITHQAVFNLYFSDVEGGDTQIHDVQWSPDALKYRDPANYGYFPTLVDGRQKARFHPKAGDLYIFNSKNMHQVLPVDPSCKIRRMAMASFFGVLPPSEGRQKTRLIFWS